MSRIALKESNGLKKPSSIHTVLGPPCTPEMNPIEQIRTEQRKRGFRNDVFDTLRMQQAGQAEQWTACLLKRFEALPAVHG